MSDMLTSLRIDCFRGLSDLTFEPLSRINVLTGFNNSGKTTVLEALYLLFANHNQLQSYPSVFRSAHGNMAERLEHFWRWLLPSGDFSKEAQLHAMTDDKKRIGLIAKQHQQQRGTLSIQYLDSSRGTVSCTVSGNGVGPLQARPWPRMEFFSPGNADPTADAEQYNRVQLIGGGEEHLVELMRVVEPRLRKLRYAKVTSQPLLYVDIGLDALVPASQMGHAFCRMLTLYMEMLVTEADILLIDEIENGLHHSVYENVWKGIAALAWSENIQIFVTTHSEECVVAAAKAAKRGEDHGFSHHRLQEFEDEVVVNTSQEILGATIPPKVGEIMRRKKAEAATKGNKEK
jgi:AAA domain, putative AbiEii toxin, Type IV TA system/AAA ATPase domain